MCSGSQFWLFRDLSLQDGYPQPLSTLRMGLSFVGVEGAEEEAAGRQGLVWDPEEGPIWGYIREAAPQHEADVWTQLLREGVSGITTDIDGQYTANKGFPHGVYSVLVNSPDYNKKQWAKTDTIIALLMEDIRGWKTCLANQVMVHISSIIPCR